MPPRRPSAVVVCCIPANTANGACPWPVPEGASVPLCARHLLLAKGEVDELGGEQLLKRLVRAEGVR